MWFFFSTLTFLFRLILQTVIIRGTYFLFLSIKFSRLDQFYCCHVHWIYLWASVPFVDASGLDLKWHALKWAFSAICMQFIWTELVSALISYSWCWLCCFKDMWLYLQLPTPAKPLITSDKHDSRFKTSSLCLHQQKRNNTRKNERRIRLLFLCGGKGDCNSIRSVLFK